ncbi:MAG: sulfotransferase domain-containing protein [Cyanobacteria bacterium J06555_3]
MRLPNFIIIGAAKSGTTTLYEYLCRHPQIFMSDPKEPNFFASDRNYAQGLDWYAQLFQGAKAEQMVGEASTPYTHQLHIPDVPQRIFQTVPQVKLIYIMRHPVDRAYSQYLQQIKIFQSRHYKAKLEAFKIPETFEELLARGNQTIEAADYMEQIDVLAASNYLEIINRYLQFFSRDSCLFLLFRDLIQEPAKTVDLVCDFLEIERATDLMQQTKIEANVSAKHKEWYLRSRLTAPLKAVPGLNRFATLLPQEIRDGVYTLLNQLPYKKSLARAYLPEQMLPETRTALLAKFAEPNRQLANFLQLDLSHWNY